LQVLQLCFFPWFPPLPPLSTGIPSSMPLPPPPKFEKDTSADCPRASATAKVAAGKYSLQILPVAISARGFRGDGSYVDFAETLMPQRQPVQISRRKMRRWTFPRNNEPWSKVLSTYWLMQ
jgi:hypothetical protein